MLQKRVSGCFLLFGILFFILSPALAQDFDQLLRKAYSSGDSSDIYFSQAKVLIKTKTQQAEYDFCKNAVFSDRGILDSTLYYGNKALPVFKELKDLNKQIYVLNNMAKACQSAGKHEQAIQIYFEALPIANEMKSSLWEVWLNQGISLNYHDFSNYSKGVFYGKKAYEIAIQNIEEDPISVVHALNAIGINYDDWTKYDSALIYHYQVMDLKDRIDTLQIGFTYNNIGNTLIKLGRYQEAEGWIKTAIKISEINNNNTVSSYYDLATYYTNLGRINTKTSNFPEAEKSLFAAKGYSLKSNSKEKIGDCYEAIYELYKISNRADSALFYHELLTRINDSIFNEKNAKLITETEVKYQVAEKEKILAQEKLKSQKILFGSISIVLTLIGFLIVGSLLMRQQKLKNLQQRKEIELQKVIAQVETQNKLQEQRLTISRDLHDNIGVQLTFIIMSVDHLKQAFQPINEKILEQLDSINSFTKSTILELRDTIWAMNQVEMSWQDIRVRMLNFMQKARLSDKTQVEIDLDASLENKKLTSFEGVNIYRILQECIHNAVKHADANLLKIQISNPEPDQIKLTIEDDGVGFDPEEADLGNGILNLKKRVSDLKGKFSLQSSPNKGTRIDVILTNIVHG